MPYSYCKSKSTKCIIKEGYKNCSKYIRCSYTCNSKGVSIAKGLFLLISRFFCTNPRVVDYLVQAKAYLEANKEAIEEELLDL